MRWVLQLQGSTRVVVAQDLLVLAKTLAASLALQYITRPAQLIECSPAQYTAYYVEKEPGGGEQPHCVSAKVGAGEVQSTCQPRIDLGGLDTAFVWLIFANQVLSFLFFSFLLVGWNQNTLRCGPL